MSYLHYKLIFNKNFYKRTFRRFFYYQYNIHKNFLKCWSSSRGSLTVKKLYNKKFNKTFCNRKNIQNELSQKSYTLPIYRFVVLRSHILKVMHPADDRVEQQS